MLIFALAAWFVLEIFVERSSPGCAAPPKIPWWTWPRCWPLALDDMQEGKMANGRLASAFARLNQSPINALIDGHLKQQAEYRIYVTDAKAGWSTTQTGWIWAGLLALERRLPDPAQRIWRPQHPQRSPDDPASSVMHVAARCRKG